MARLGFCRINGRFEKLNAIHPVESSSTKTEEKPLRDKSFFSRGNAPSTRECVHLLVSASNNYKLRSYVLTARELNTRRVRVVAELLVSTAKGNIILQFAKMLVSYRQLHLYRMIGRPMKVRRFVTPLSL